MTPHQMSMPFFEESDSSENFYALIKDLGVEKTPGWPDRFGMAINSWMKRQSYPPINTLSLFSGGGGLDIGFHDAGFQIVELVEIDKRFTKTLEKNALPGGLLNSSRVHCIDIRDFQPSDDLKVDFIIGGPPCQTFSAAGRRAAGVTGTDDPRGTLFEEYVRLLLALKPKGFLFENVYGIVGAQKGEAWRDIQTAFRSAGYRIFWRILDAADYGVPQHRERLIIVGLSEGEYYFPYPTHGPDALGNAPYYSAKEAVQGVDTTNKKDGLGGQYGHLLEGIPPGLNYSYYTEKMGHPNPVFGWRSKFSDFLYKADPDRPVRTIKASGGQYTGPFSWENRAFTIDELKRLQTFPDAYELVGTEQNRKQQIGNSVPPQLARILALSILDQVMDISIPISLDYMSHNHQLGFRKRKRQLTKLYAQKAAEAISLLEPDVSVSSQVYEEISNTERFLAANFDWSTKPKHDSARVTLEFKLTDQEWSISAGNDKQNLREQICYSVRVMPSSENGWLVPTRRVTLIGHSFNISIFTSLWKALEEKLNHYTSMADLVQLNGYYQYEPQIAAQMDLLSEPSSQDIVWNTVKAVVEGKGVARQQNVMDYAYDFDVGTQNIYHVMEALREFGFEVRNWNTNPTIPQDEYLIPYAFPTFTPRSVQLYKRL